MKSRKESIQMLQKYCDNELTDIEMEKFVKEIENNQEFQDEIKWNEIVSTTLQNEIDDICDDVHFPNLVASVNERIDIDRDFGVFEWLSGLVTSKPKWIATAFVSCAMIALFMFTALPDLVNDLHDRNDCIVDSIENMHSTSVVYEAGAKDEEITVIWLYEDENS